MLNKGLLIVISGPSGTGKGTLCKALFNKNKTLNFSVSCTTRAKREGEIHGVNYFFIEKDEFTHMIENDEFLEYAKVYDNYYGTPKAYVEKLINEGKDIVLEIDIQGALNIKEKYPEGVYIFILPPSMEELKHRIVNRGSETKESLEKRFSSAFNEVNYYDKYNYVVVNDVLDDALNKIEAIITSEKCSSKRIKESGINIQEVLKNE